MNEDKKKINDFIKLLDWVEKTEEKKLKQLSKRQKAAGRKVVDDYIEVCRNYFAGGNYENS